MAWWNPRTWFNKKRTADPQSIPVPPPETMIPEPHLWVRVSPENPHQGFDHFSDALANPFPYALLLLGLNPDAARTALVGKVLDWMRLTPAQLAEFENNKTLMLLYSDLQGLLR